MLRAYTAKLVHKLPRLGDMRVWIQVCVFCFFFFFLQPQLLTKSAVNSAFTVPQTSLFNHFFIKNRFHGIIHIFKNYFTTVFSIFNFQFQQNKFYPNHIYQTKQENKPLVKTIFIGKIIKKDKHICLASDLQRKSHVNLPRTLSTRFHC